MVDEKDNPESDGPEAIALDAIVCLEQAGNVLMVAEQMAATLNDTPSMLSVAAGWIELSSRFNPPEGEDYPRRKSIGFSTFPKTVEEELDERSD